MTEHDRRSLAAYRGWTTRKKGKPAEQRCPGCGERIRSTAIDHIKRKHADLYARRAAKYGDLI